MKRTKLILSIMMVFTLIFSLGSSVFAADFPPGDYKGELKKEDQVDWVRFVVPKGVKGVTFKLTLTSPGGQIYKVSLYDADKQISLKSVEQDITGTYTSLKENTAYYFRVAVKSGYSTDGNHNYNLNAYYTK
ncbi:hypothetical protein [Paenibacillus chitinolyticus]|uniref:hypothetical protein n=1 Tax=Paenibacillus chitinolyticus TaxID=79263 RepID=UPI00366A00DB